MIKVKTGQYWIDPRGTKNPATKSFRGAWIGGKEEYGFRLSWVLINGKRHDSGVQWTERDIHGTLLPSEPTIVAQILERYEV